MSGPSSLARSWAFDSNPGSTKNRTRRAYIRPPRQGLAAPSLPLRKLQNTAQGWVRDGCTVSADTQRPVEPPHLLGRLVGQTRGQVFDQLSERPYCLDLDPLGSRHGVAFGNNRFSNQELPRVVACVSFLLP